MDERAALGFLADRLEHAGDDAAIIEDLLLTTDMLHEQTDFPPGTSRYTAGWRAVGASLSDIAAMGGTPTGAVAVYAAPTFEESALTAFVDGATAVCDQVGAAYVGGDLDTHEEFTVVSTALGHASEPVRRSGARPGDVVWVSGQLGRTAAALEHFERGETDRANDLFQFVPRIATGRAVADHATAMMDSSDGLVRSAHQLAAASDVAIDLESAAVPVHPALAEVVPDEGARLEAATTLGEDFELVGTAPAGALEGVETPAPITVVGAVRAGSGVTMDGAPVADEGYTHG